MLKTTRLPIRFQVTPEDTFVGLKNALEQRYRSVTWQDGIIEFMVPISTRELTEDQLKSVARQAELEELTAEQVFEEIGTNYTSGAALASWGIVYVDKRFYRLMGPVTGYLSLLRTGSGPEVIICEMVAAKTDDDVVFINIHGSQRAMIWSEYIDLKAQALRDLLTSFVRVRNRRVS